ncbi:pyridoxal phosphate-dependent aminotransferase [Porticoccus litoralis]|uniref:Aminotransferase n=1 Tax=Porticoccus litoralis TaxID=434086 RepID=A0AAW8B3I6_9GAMM|nr:pyridoxal phosphate-dependent aminotransferase [Porticoccus litoralis]MDP1520314.1 pyridoxal phosphate-dependent aminotransferase [Porticoccus litoralis]
MTKLANRTRNLTSFKVVDFLEAAQSLEAQGRDIIHMEIGEPRFETAAPILEAARVAMTEGRTGYTPSCGIPELRQAIADFYAEQYEVAIDARRVIVTTGSSAALGMVCELLLNPGDGLLLADPGYPCNANFVRRLDAEPQLVPVGPDENYQLSAASVEEYWRPNSVAAMVASPSNPTGTVIDQQQLAELYRQVKAQQGILIVDEIYHGLTYSDVPLSSALSVADDLFVINSFSKYFGMTGWRLGWMVVPEPVIDTLTVMAQNFYIASPSIAQYAALAAFQPDTREILEQRRQAFQARRDFLLPALRELGFRIDRVPEGAFYLYADVSTFTDDCEAFCWQLLREHGIACTPGTDFGHHKARQHIRFAYTESLPRLEVAVDRLRRALKG